MAAGRRRARAGHVDGADVVKAVAGLRWIAWIVGSVGVLLLGVAALCWTPLTADHARLILDYLRVIASWPAVVFFLGVVVFCKFEDPIAHLIKNITTVRGPGFALQASQPVDNVDSPTSAPTSNTAGAELAKQWEFHYLNYFLAPTTQWILELLCNTPSSVTRQEFESALLPYVPNSVETNAIHTALLTHKLIEECDTHNIKATEKGREYRTFRGSFETISRFWWAAHVLPAPTSPPAPTSGHG